MLEPQVRMASAPIIPREDEIQPGYELPCETIEIGGAEARLFRVPEGTEDVSRTVVCLPGLGASGRSFAPLRALSDKYRFLFWTPPLKTPEGKIPLEFNLCALRDAKALPDTFALVGSSYGSLVALSFALWHPDRVKALVLISPVASTNKIRNGALLAQQAMRVPLPFAYVFAPAVARVLGGRELPKDAAAELIREARRIAPHEMSRRLKDILSAELMPRLHELQMPVLVIHGTRDRVVPTESAKDVAQAIAHAELQLIEGAGHLPYMSHPEEFNAALDRFLNGVRPS